MNSQAAYRRATLDDLDGLLALEAKCYPDPWTAQSFVAELRNPASVTWVLEQAAFPRGHIVWRVTPDGLELLNIAVDPACRGRGLAKGLMGLLLEAARIQPEPQVFLDVRAGNVAALGLYRSLGFRQVGLRKHYYRVGGEDAVLMRWSAKGAP